MLDKTQQPSEPHSSSSEPNPGEDLPPPAYKPGDDATVSAPENSGNSGPAAAHHPRMHLGAEWKWKGTVSIIFLTSMINGYDVSNVANIQPRLYEAFGSIELLPWIGLSYSLANFAVLSFARKITYCTDMRWIYIVSMVLFMAGAAVAGSAESMSSVIGGRIIMGIGGAIVQQTNMSYMAVFATAAETPGLFATMSAMWAVGLVVGGPIGAAFAENSSATWRWAFYLNLPLVGLGLVIAFLCVPSHSLAPAGTSLLQRLKGIDPLGILFNAAAPVLFSLAATFSGPIWAWDSAASIVTWVVFGLVLIAWAVQQVFCIFTTEEERAFPVHILARYRLIPIWVASGCAGASYAVTLYYTPLFFAFARGHDALQQTVRLLPFILVFIVVVLLTGGLLPVIKVYKPVYCLAGLFTLVGATAMTVMLRTDVSESLVMGLEALIGVGLGMHFQHGFGISNVINRDNARDRVDSTVVCNMLQMGSIAGILAVAGCVFQNEGYNVLRKAVTVDGETPYSEEEIREALAGVSSAVWQSRDPEVLRKGIDAVTEVISDEFYIVLAAGILCMLCSAVMKWEKLDYRRPAPATAQEKEQGSASAQHSIGADNAST